MLVERKRKSSFWQSNTEIIPTYSYRILGNPLHKFSTRSGNWRLRGKRPCETSPYQIFVEMLIFVPCTNPWKRPLEIFLSKKRPKTQFPHQSQSRTNCDHIWIWLRAGTMPLKNHFKTDPGISWGCLGCVSRFFAGCMKNWTPFRQV